MSKVKCLILPLESSKCGQNDNDKIGKTPAQFHSLAPDPGVWRGGRCLHGLLLLPLVGSGGRQLAARPQHALPQAEGRHAAEVDSV